MLVLTRKVGEVVNIGGDVEVFVVGVSSGRVKLGFRAPRDTVIQRAEVASRGNLPNARAPAADEIGPATYPQHAPSHAPSVPVFQ